jgi:hypothetical protein
MAGILAFQHVRHEPPGLFAEVLATPGHRVKICRANREPLPGRLPANRGAGAGSWRRSPA